MSLKITKITQEIYLKPEYQHSLRYVLGQASECVGLTSLRKSVDDLMTDIEESLKGYIKDFFIIEVDDEVIGITAISYKRNHYYDLRSKKVETLYTCAELCSTFVLPAYRGEGYYKEIFEYRLNYIEKVVGIKKIVVEVRAEYVDGLPVKLAANRQCWNGEPTAYYNEYSLKDPLVDDGQSVCEESTAVQKLCLDNGFKLLGINVYDNGPHYIKELP